MANKQIFSSTRGALLPKTDTRNRAGGTAYNLSAKQGLAQYAATGCFGDTFYTSAKEQISEVLKLAAQVEPEFVAKCAVYGRQKGYMKDMPAFLLAFLAAQGPEGVKLVGRTFPKVIDNGKMLRNFVQIIRSGQVGRKSFGTALKRFIRDWLDGRRPDQIFRDTVGNDPSMADVIKMVHPTPKDASRKALYGYITGRPAEGKQVDGKPALPGWNPDELPLLVKEYEQYKKTKVKDGVALEVPNVPFQMLDSLGLDKDGWTRVARDAKWMMTRMNVNTFTRHGVFEDENTVDLVAGRLANPEEIKRARAFPYQLMMAYLMTTDAPFKVREALQDAMEVAISNVPALGGRVVICPDVSGSMHSPITGSRGAGTSRVQCVHVAALMTAAIMRQNRDAFVIPFADRLYGMNINPRDSVMTIAKTIGQCPGGGTYLSLPLAYLVQEKAKVDHLIFISDNQSWMDSGVWGDATQTMQMWEMLKRTNPNAKMYCINIVPGSTTQAKNRKDILNIGGFNDTVFDLLKLFAESTGGEDHWVKLIDSIEV
jgi:60 kDa SS-A/Ro ribonucleoprotein